MKIGGIMQRMLRRASPRIRARGTLLRHFATSRGLVYFGTVDQHEDEHEVIRGLTVSMTHKDTHYAVGSFDGYDVSIVDRFDVGMSAERRPIEHQWLIFQIDLQDARLPHTFIKPLGHSPTAYNRFFTAFTTLHRINEVLELQHSPEFHARYEVFGVATHAPDIEAALSPFVTQTIAARFWPHAIEIYEGKLYIYITEHRLDETVLAATLQGATWLAAVLDGKQN